MCDTLGHVKACHDPRNERCPHNANIIFDCSCKSAVAVERKPFKVVRVDDPTVETHGLSSRLVLSVYPNGLLMIREQGRRTVYTTTLGKVYEGIVWRTAMMQAKARKAGRGGKKGGRK